MAEVCLCGEPSPSLSWPCTHGACHFVDPEKFVPLRDWLTAAEHVRPTCGNLVEFDALMARRVAGEPLAYLLGSAFFAGLEFAVSPDVLIPRPETEVLVGEAQRLARNLDAPRIVDLGTGAGIVAIVLARLCPSAQVTAVDLSSAALASARANAARHGATIRFLHGDWYEPLGEERFDLIVSNPPYVADGDPHLRRDGLPFEPQIALTDGIAGGDGLACIRRIVAAAAEHLLPGGWLLIEHGYDQAVEVSILLSRAGFSEIGSWRDSAAIARVTGGVLTAATGRATLVS